jgi:hypothetical protein
MSPIDPNTYTMDNLDRATNIINNEALSISRSRDQSSSDGEETACISASWSQGTEFKRFARIVSLALSLAYGSRGDVWWGGDRACVSNWAGWCSAAGITNCELGSTDSSFGWAGGTGASSTTSGSSRASICTSRVRSRWHNSWNRSASLIISNKVSAGLCRH